MTTTTVKSRAMGPVQKQSSRRAKAGFTLTELIVATSISGIVLASMVGTFLTFAIGVNSVGAYTGMSRDSRMMLEYFGRDVRLAEEVLVANASTLRIVSPDTDLYSASTVTYQYDDETKSFSRIETDSSGNEVSDKVLLDGLEQFVFSYFDPLGNSLSVDTPSILLSVKSVQVDAEMLRDISKTQVTDYIISARFMMRNRPVTE